MIQSGNIRSLKYFKRVNKANVNFYYKKKFSSVILHFYKKDSAEIESNL